MEACSRISLIDKQHSIFLIDIVMKKVSGIKMVQKIREYYPTSVIIVVSSVSDNRIITTALSKGANDFILKPFNPDIFLAKIFARVN